MNRLQLARKRHRLIEAIQKRRGSAVITYILGDRPNAPTQIAEDQIRPIYDHLRALGHVKKLDLFIFSRGGHLEVPWRIVSMIREHADDFAVIIPYRAMSAATMIALGADEIVAGPKAELGPIDPQVTIQHGEGGTVVREVLSVEDIMSYIAFLRDRVGLTEQHALAGPISTLVEKLHPWTLGSINRVHSHVRDVARKMITARRLPPDDQRAQLLIEMLAEKTYQHGHAISRTEAEEIGFQVVRPDRRLDKQIWDLFETYEDVCQLRSASDPASFLPANSDSHSEELVMACIESMNRADHFTAQMRATRERKQAPQLSATLNLSIQLPANIQPEEVPEAAQKEVNNILQNLQGIAQQVLRAELEQQMPTVNIKLSLEKGWWRRVEDWPPPKPSARTKKEGPKAT